MYLLLTIILCAGAGLFLYAINPVLGIILAVGFTLACLLRVIDLLEDIHKELVLKPRE
ncbi:hypothetical protein [Jeotgalibacillus campisalis]|uniref:Uncharacterized protein n=1 Tax=Jeotgalibacillus campisalis TaxID=220754 RepID=A0A0C2RLJ1_9BACL|nr:hypothetical protein [Jeotgalibacillus campisalis]KIL51105.1 hypothetical protein KR50_09860 [Jeotgalibacillus campisalis]